MVPMELPSHVKTVRGEVRDWQAPRTKIHISNEQPNLTPVFGESCPPRGLSGMLRDYAYQFGEGANRHWMTLMLADRVNMMESTIIDALRGKPDNYVREKGWSAIFKYGNDEDKRRMMTATLIGVGIVAAALLIPAASKRRRR
jgi:hypothetical protein